MTMNPSGNDCDTTLRALGTAAANAAAVLGLVFVAGCGDGGTGRPTVFSAAEEIVVTGERTQAILKENESLRCDIAVVERVIERQRNIPRQDAELCDFAKSDPLLGANEKVARVILELTKARTLYQKSVSAAEQGRQSIGASTLSLTELESRFKLRNIKIARKKLMADLRELHRLRVSAMSSPVALSEGARAEAHTVEKRFARNCEDAARLCDESRFKPDDITFAHFLPLLETIELDSRRQFGFMGARRLHINYDAGWKSFLSSGQMQPGLIVKGVDGVDQPRIPVEFERKKNAFSVNLPSAEEGLSECRLVMTPTVVLLLEDVFAKGKEPRIAAVVINSQTKFAWPPDGSGKGTPIE